jgi:CRP/FNR family transcriptional regulator, cyclic AMP receptor protein
MRGWSVEIRLPPGNGDALTGVEMFAGLEPEERQRVIAAAVPRTYRKGQVLFVENDPGDSLIVLKRGAVAVYRTSAAGERALLSVVRPPDVFGEVSLLDGSARSASAEAIEDSTALALSRAAFLDLVHSNPRILDAVMRSLGALIRRLTDQNADHVFLDLPGRVAKALVRLAGDSQAPMVTIELNQSQLAEMAGGSRQSVNQAIGSFASRGWLRTEGRRIVVTDLAALRRRAGMPDKD